MTDKTQTQQLREINTPVTDEVRELLNQRIAGQAPQRLWALVSDLEFYTEPLARLIARVERLVAYAEAQAAETVRQVAQSKEDKMSTGEKETMARQFAAEEKEYLAELRGMAHGLSLKIDITRQRIGSLEVKITRTVDSA